jgi:hypothetical protein
MKFILNFFQFECTSGFISFFLGFLEIKIVWIVGHGFVCRINVILVILSIAKNPGSIIFNRFFGS